MARGQIEVVVGSVEVGRHRRNEMPAVLAPIGLRQLDARNLGDRIPLVGRLQRSGQQRRFRDRLIGEPGIDARRAEKQQLPDADLMGGVDDVRLDHEVVVEEFRRSCRVGQNAADRGRGDEDGLGPLASPSTPARPPARADRLRRGRGSRSVHASLFSRRVNAAPTMPRCPATQTRFPARSNISRSAMDILPILVARDQLEILAHHLRHHVTERRRMSPPEALARLRCVAEQ